MIIIFLKLILPNSLLTTIMGVICEGREKDYNQERILPGNFLKRCSLPILEKQFSMRISSQSYNISLQEIKAKAYLDFFFFFFFYGGMLKMALITIIIYYI